MVSALAAEQGMPLGAAEAERGSAPVWRLLLMTGCIGHGCRLADATEIAISITL